MLVNPKYYDRARRELCRRFPLQLVDFEGMFLDALQETADNAKVSTWIGRNVAGFTIGLVQLRAMLPMIPGTVTPV